MLIKRGKLKTEQSRQIKQMNIMNFGKTENFPFKDFKIGDSFYLQVFNPDEIPTYALMFTAFFDNERTSRYLPQLNFGGDKKKMEDFFTNQCRKVILGLGIPYVILYNQGVIGFIFLTSPEGGTAFKKWTIDFVIAEPFEGKGIMTVALNNIFYYLKRDIHVSELYAIVKDDNKRCVNLLDKLDFKRQIDHGFSWEQNYSKEKPLLYMIDLEKYR